jgi:hypothetical protein
MNERYAQVIHSFDASFEFIWALAGRVHASHQATHAVSGEPRGWRGAKCRGEDRRFEIRQITKPSAPIATYQCRWLGLVLLVTRRRDARQLSLPQCAE